MEGKREGSINIHSLENIHIQINRERVEPDVNNRDEDKVVDFTPWCFGAFQLWRRSVSECTTDWVQVERSCSFVESYLFVIQTTNNEDLINDFSKKKSKDRRELIGLRRLIASSSKIESEVESTWTAFSSCWIVRVPLNSEIQCFIVLRVPIYLDRGLKLLSRTNRKLVFLVRWSPVRNRPNGHSCFP